MLRGIAPALSRLSEFTRDAHTTTTTHTDVLFRGHIVPSNYYMEDDVGLQSVGWYADSLGRPTLFARLFVLVT